MSIDVHQPIATIVTEHPETAAVLSRHRIDFCCRGAQPLSHACEERGLDRGALGGELERAIAARVGEPREDVRALPDAALIQRIVDRHHGYLRETLPFLVPLAQKVARVHGDKDPHLAPLRDAVEELMATLLPHLDREEDVLFPGMARGDRALLDRELAAMGADHEGVGALLARIRGHARDYAIPEGACRSWSTLLRELEALEADVLVHVHLENHVLAPRFAARRA